MALFEITGDDLQRVPPGSFAAEGVRERVDLQQWLRKNPGALGESLLVIAEEFRNWEDSRRRIDLLALDEDANLVVIELKRTEDGGHVELQALRYAAMVSAMRFEDVVRAFEDFLATHEPEHKDQARERVLQFLGAEELVEISNVPRVVLVSADFSLEVTTTVLWLIDRGIDVRCVQLVPSKVGQRLLVDIKQVIPLAQAEDYQVRLRQKREEARTAASGERRELTLKALLRHGVIRQGTETGPLRRSGQAPVRLRCSCAHRRIPRGFKWRGMVQAGSGDGRRCRLDHGEGWRSRWCRADPGRPAPTTKPVRPRSHRAAARDPSDEAARRPRHQDHGDCHVDLLRLRLRPR
jgi:hypothetical protein